ncbi:MAG: hypothetical protein WA126_16230 [Thermodesulfovibrionales bacterium]
MTKGLYIIIACLIMVLSAVANVHAGPMKSQEEFKQKMNAHIEKMKLKNPQKHQFMIERAGGNVTQCTDCHQELLKGNLPGQKGIESISPLKK